MTSSSADDISALLAAEDSTLPCSRSIDELLEQAADGRGDDLDPHQQRCVHCQSALRELTRIWQPVRTLAAEPVAAPTDLLRTVLARVHRLVDNVWYTLHVTDIGAVSVAARIVARIARDTARAVPGVHAALGRSTLDHRLARLVESATRRHRNPNAAVGVLGRTAAVDLAVAVTYGQHIPDVAAEIQRRVTRELRDTIGLQDVTINITVDDVQPPPSRP